MFAKLYFESGWSHGTDLLPVIASILSGTTNVNAVPGATAKFNPSLSYVLTSKNVAGWTLESSGTNIRILSAPCKDSTKKKYIKLDATAANSLALTLGEGFSGTNLTGQVTLHETSYYSAVVINSISGQTHITSQPIEVWISASSRHFLVAANVPGYAHGIAINGRAGGWVSGVVEHTPADSWLSDNSTYIPACVMSTLDNTASAPITFLRNRTRNIAAPAPTDFTNEVNGSKLYSYTKYGSGPLNLSTLAGSNLIQLNENEAVKALLPFGARNKVALVRGGSISDVCDIYLAPSTIFRANLQIQVGENVENRYHIWNLGFTTNNLAINYNLAVPRG